MSVSITVIATVLNEGDNIHHLMRSLAAQTQQPDAVIIVDGGSRDHTVAIIQQYADQLPLQVIVQTGCNISEGRNIAISAADDASIIAATDAGVRLEPDWLAHLTQPLRDDPALNVVGGFFLADVYTPFEVAMGAAVLPLADEIDPVTFLPSSRSIAFRKSAWAKAGRYPEWLDFCEDLIFDIRIKALAPGFAFAPHAIVHFRPRTTLKAYYKQYYLYARGDGKADLWRKRHAIRYLTYCVAAPLIVLLGVIIHPALWLFAVLGAAIYFAPAYRRLPVVMQQSGLTDTRTRIIASLWIPVIRVVGDIAKMIGYPLGWRWRLQHQPPDWTP